MEEIDLKARLHLLSEAAPAIVNRWPAPTESIESAAAFLRTRRSGAVRELERRTLAIAFYPLPAFTLSKAKLRAGKTAVIKALRFLRALSGTRATERFAFLEDARTGLALTLGATQQLLDESLDNATDRRRRIDGWSARLRATVNVLVMAEHSGYRAPSVREFCALAVLLGLERPTGSDELRAARVEEKWKKIRLRAARNFAEHRVQLLEEARAYDVRIQSQFQEREALRDAKEAAQKKGRFLKALREAGMLSVLPKQGGTSSNDK